MVNELRLLKKKNEILMQGVKELANQPRLLSYGVMDAKHQGIDEERRRTVILMRDLIKKVEEVT